MGIGFRRLDFLDFLDGTFARQHHELAAEFPREPDSGAAGHGHLGGGVDRKIRGEPANQAADADILHDGRVDAGGDDGTQVLLRLLHLVLEDKRVEGDVAADAAPVQELHQFRQVGDGEIVGAHARVEAFQPEVDRIRPVFHRGPGTFPVSGGREQFRPAAA